MYVLERKICTNHIFYRFIQNLNNIETPNDIFYDFQSLEDTSGTKTSQGKVIFCPFCMPFSTITSNTFFSCTTLGMGLAWGTIVLLNCLSAFSSSICKTQVQVRLVIKANEAKYVNLKKLSPLPLPFQQIHTPPCISCTSFPSP